MRYCLLILLSFISIKSFAQVDKVLKEISDSVQRYSVQKITEIDKDDKKGKYFSEKAYDRFYDKFFTQLNFDRDNFTNGNSASLKVTDNSTKLNLSLSAKNRFSIFTLGTNLNISDSSGVIFSKREPSAGTEIFGNYSIIIPQWRKLNFDGPYMQVNILKRRNLIDSLSAVHVSKNSEYYKSLLHNRQIYDSLVKRYDYLKSMLDNRKFAMDPDKLKLHYFDFEMKEYITLVQQLISNSTINLNAEILKKSGIKDSVAKFNCTGSQNCSSAVDVYTGQLIETFLAEQGFAFGDLLVGTIDKRLKNISETEGFESLAKSREFVDDLTEAAEKREIEKQLETNAVTSFRMVWLSGGMSYRRDQYGTYNNALDFSKRIGEKNFDRWSANVGINFVWQRTEYWRDWLGSSFISSVFLNANFSLVKTNTYEDLEQQAISKIITSTLDDTTYEFTTEKKLRDISDKTYSSGFLKRVNGSASFMFGKSQFFGINLSGQFDYKDDEKTRIDTKYGLLFRFKDSDDEKSIVNFEIFLALKDMSDTKNTANSAWQNKEIGVSARLPFKKVFFR